MFTLSIAYKFFKSKKSQTLLILFGFAIGISVNIFVGSLIQSLQTDLINSTVGSQPQITIVPANNQTYVDNWQNIMSYLKERSDIKVSTSSLDGRTFITNIHPDSPDDVVLRGVDLNTANQIYDIFNPETYVGSKPNNEQVIIGKDLASELNVSISDKLEFKTDPSPFATSQNLTISGIFDLKVKDLNQLWVFTPYTTAETVFNTSDQVTGIYIQVNDVFQADTIAKEIQNKIGNENITIENWKEKNQSLLSGLQAQSSSTNIIQAFVLLSVVIGIASILSITVIQKSRQIGILKAMGLNDRRSAYVFIFQGLLYGIFGSILGTALGVGLIYSFNTFAGGKEAGLFDIGVSIPLVILTNVIAVIFSIMAAMIPARTSSRMEVIDIIRNN